MILEGCLCKNVFLPVTLEFLNITLLVKKIMVRGKKSHGTTWAQ